MAVLPAYSGSDKMQELYPHPIDRYQFHIGLALSCLLCAVLYYYTRSKLKSSTDASFTSFQRTYLIGYLLAMAADWLQGPHVWALYNSYGMSTLQIQLLFIAGFGSSMLVGTFVGSLADKYGRRNNCILYAVMYGMACVTKHFNNFHILMLGRLLGGMATSILYSAFESWMVCEFNKRSLEPELLKTIFSHAVLGNSLVAVGSGLVAQTFADKFGYVAPFDVSLSVLITLAAVLVYTWPENYGSQGTPVTVGMRRALHLIRSDGKVLCLGLIQSLFEGAMYTFVLEWTPALTPLSLRVRREHPDGRTSDEFYSENSIPHGIIFAAFMVAVMTGSSLFKLLSARTSPESLMRPVLLVSAASLAVPILFTGHQKTIFLSFLVFEVCVGIFWPAMGTMRGKYVPEETRSTVMNFFRVPLNLLVVAILCQTLLLEIIFAICVIFLTLAFFMQVRLYRLSLGGLSVKDAPLPVSGQDGGEFEVIDVKQAAAETTSAAAVD